MLGAYTLKSIGSLVLRTCITESQNKTTVTVTMSVEKSSRNADRKGTIGSTLLQRSSSHKQKMVSLMSVGLPQPRGRGIFRESSTGEQLRT